MELLGSPSVRVNWKVILQPFLTRLETCTDIGAVVALLGYPLKAGQLEYDCRYSKMHGMPVTSGRGFRGLKPL